VAATFVKALQGQFLTKEHRMFRKAIDELFDQQRQRLECAIGTERVAKAFEALESTKLDSESIDGACCAELKHILQKRYESPVANSTRLGGLGWSMAHVQDHMRRFLQTKVRAAGDILRSHVDANFAVSAETDVMELFSDASLEPELNEDLFQAYVQEDEMASDLNMFG